MARGYRFWFIMTSHLLPRDMSIRAGAQKYFCFMQPFVDGRIMTPRDKKVYHITVIASRPDADGANWFLFYMNSHFSP